MVRWLGGRDASCRGCRRAGAGWRAWREARNRWPDHQGPQDLHYLWPPYLDRWVSRPGALSNREAGQGPPQPQQAAERLSERVAQSAYPASPRWPRWRWLAA